MKRIEFNNSEKPTVGVEIELALVNERTMALHSGMADILEALPASLHGSIKPELMQCYVEINTCVCDDIPHAERDLREKLRALHGITDDLGMRLYWSGTHPFSLWKDQQVSDVERYHGLINLLQDTARQLITFGLHVHVGVNSGDKAVMICDRILRYLPLLLAASANSPFWDGRVTGLNSWRIKVMDGLPTAGLPPLMRNWSEYVWLINHLIETGFIESIREIWWDVRPHHNFGTVEVRICDVPGSLDDALALAAFVQCLIKALSDEIDIGTYQHDTHPMMVRQNKWRAARYGLDAPIVHSTTFDVKPAREVLRNVAERLMPHAETLNCTQYMQHLLEMCDKPCAAQHQLAMLESLDNPAEMVRQMTNATRIE